LTNQLEMLSERVIGGGENLLNAMSQRMYVDGAQMRGGKSEGLRRSYPRLIRNQSWTKNNDESWYEGECEDAKCVPPFNIHYTMNTPTDGLLTKILKKMEGSDMILQEMKSDVLDLSTTIISHSSSIKFLEENMR